jgi:hypothetical protein
MNNQGNNATEGTGLGLGIILILSALFMRYADWISRKTEALVIIFGVGFLFVGISVHLSRLKLTTGARVVALIALILLIIGIVLSCHALTQ